MHETIFRQLQPVRHRQRTASVLRAAAWGLVGGSAAAVVFAVLRLTGWNSTVWAGWGLLMGLPLAAAVAVAVWSWLNTSWLPAARAVDGHYELKDRTETALAFLRHEQAGQTDDLQQLQLADAVQHLQRIEAKQVVPFALPKSFRWSLATTALAVVLLCWPTGYSQLSAGPSKPLDAIIAEAEIVEEDLQKLLDELPEEHSPEIEALIKEMLAKAEELKEPGVDLREALAKLSEMQSALQVAAAEFNVAATDEAMKSIGEALQSAEALQEAGKALQQGQYDKAAEQLAKLDNPKLDRKESRAVSDKLKKASESAGQQGMKKLSEAAKEAAEGLDKDNPSQCKSGLCKLGGAPRSRGTARRSATCSRSSATSSASANRTARGTARTKETNSPTSRV